MELRHVLDEPVDKLDSEKLASITRRRLSEAGTDEWMERPSARCELGMKMNGACGVGAAGEGGIMTRHLQPGGDASTEDSCSTGQRFPPRLVKLCSGVGGRNLKKELMGLEDYREAPRGRLEHPDKDWELPCRRVLHWAASRATNLLNERDPNSSRCRTLGGFFDGFSKVYISVKSREDGAVLQPHVSVMISQSVAFTLIMVQTRSLSWKSIHHARRPGGGRSIRTPPPSLAHLRPTRAREISPPPPQTLYFNICSGERTPVPPPTPSRRLRQKAGLPPSVLCSLIRVDSVRFHLLASLLPFISRLPSTPSAVTPFECHSSEEPPLGGRCRLMPPHMALGAEGEIRLPQVPTAYGPDTRPPPRSPAAAVKSQSVPRTCLKYLNWNTFRRRLEPPHLSLLNTKEQRFSLELPVDVCAPHPVPRGGARDTPGKKTSSCYSG
ncbi:unnamed protein product, partial [Pleuronectes platessa]